MQIILVLLYFHFVGIKYEIPLEPWTGTYSTSKISNHLAVSFSLHLCFLTKLKQCVLN